MVRSRFLTTTINTCWIGSMKRAYCQFLDAAQNTEICQREYLKQIIGINKNTCIGNEYAFGNIDSIRAYQKNVPLMTYEDYVSYIESISQGQNNILTSDQILLFEPTSGSSSATKYIPYTKRLKIEFQKAIYTWIYTLYKQYPTLIKTRSYWSISPQLNKDRMLNQMRVGFDDDSEYLGTLGRFFHSQVCVSNQNVAQIKDIDTFRSKTLLQLLLAEDLGFISVWNPTFLTLLIEYCLQNKENLLKELSIVNHKRSVFVNKHFANQSKNVFQFIWSKLKVISCWMDGASATHADILKKYFPDVYFQRKGLLATEGIISFPLEPHPEPILAVNSHFYEFIDNSSGEIKLAHQLEKGKYYSVIITTGGGLYRYQLKDIIEVTGHLYTTPTFRFVGKEDNTVDLFGEKLNEAFVSSCLTHVFSQHDLKPAFYMIAPVNGHDHSVSYALFFEDNSISDEYAGQIVLEVESKLRDNFHYDYCRKLNQLKRLKLFRIKNMAKEIFYREKMKQTIKMGDIKAVYLDHQSNWQDVFDGNFIQ